LRVKTRASKAKKKHNTPLNGRVASQIIQTFPLLSLFFAPFCSQTTKKQNAEEHTLQVRDKRWRNGGLSGVGEEKEDARA
jgi:hypothetical protein